MLRLCVVRSLALDPLPYFALSIRNAWCISPPSPSPAQNSDYCETIQSATDPHVNDALSLHHQQRVPIHQGKQQMRFPPLSQKEIESDSPSYSTEKQNMYSTRTLKNVASHRIPCMRACMQQHTFNLTAPTKPISAAAGAGPERAQDFSGDPCPPRAYGRTPYHPYFHATELFFFFCGIFDFQSFLLSFLEKKKNKVKVKKENFLPFHLCPIVISFWRKCGGPT